MNATADVLDLDRTPYAPWLATLDRIRTGGVCPRCAGKGGEMGTGFREFSGSYPAWIPCPVCRGKTPEPPPDIAVTCLTFADWLEEQNDQRASIVRPREQAADVDYNPLHCWRDFVWHWLPHAHYYDYEDHDIIIARRLLLLFREPCVRCFSKGWTKRYGEPPEQEECAECYGRGRIDFAAPKIISTVQPFTLPDDAPHLCLNCGWEAYVTSPGGRDFTVWCRAEWEVKQAYPSGCPGLRNHENHAWKAAPLAWARRHLLAVPTP